MTYRKRNINTRFWINLFAFLFFMGFVQYHEVFGNTINDKKADSRENVKGSTALITVVYGKKHIFSVVGPEAWILDEKLAKKNNLGSFFYPRKSTNPEETYMYAQGWDKDSDNPDLDTFIKGDIRTFKETDPKLKVKQMETIITHDLRKAIVYEFSNIKNVAGECVAYIDTPKSIVVIVYSSKNTKEYMKHRETFLLFVKTFHFLSDNPDKAKKILKKIHK